MARRRKRREGEVKKGEEGGGGGEKGDGGVGCRKGEGGGLGLLRTGTGMQSTRNAWWQSDFTWFKNEDALIFHLNVLLG